MNKSGMEAKAYLSRAYRIDREINAKLEQIMALRELASKATATISDMPRASSPNVCRIQDIISKIIDFEQDINQEIDRLIDIKREVSGVIGEVNSSDYRTLLELRYLCFRSWERIAVEMQYSIQHTYRIHEQALNAVRVPKVESQCD